MTSSTRASLAALGCLHAPVNKKAHVVKFKPQKPRRQVELLDEVVHARSSAALGSLQCDCEYGFMSSNPNPETLTVKSSFSIGSSARASLATFGSFLLAALELVTLP